METVSIDGKEVPISEVIAAYTKAGTLGAEIATLRAQAQAAKDELAAAADARDAIARLKTDPQFAANLVKSLQQHHADSAFFRDPTPVAPAVDPDDPKPPTPPAAASADDPRVLALEQELEVLRAGFAKDQGQRLLDSTLGQIEERFPMVKRDALLTAAAEQQVGVESLPLLAAALDRDRLEGELAAARQSDSLLDQLLSGSGATDESAIAAVGSSLTTAQLSGDAEVDYANLSTDDAILMAARSLGAEGVKI